MVMYFILIFTKIRKKNKSNRSTLYKTTKTWFLIFLLNLVKRSKNQFPYYIGKLFCQNLDWFKTSFLQNQFS